MRWVRLLVAAWAVSSSLACAAAEKAAAKDPMKCERDPNCSRGRSSYQDCYRQCVDDPACVERCQSVQQQIDGPPGARQ
jgi:hypothetical protein